VWLLRPAAELQVWDLPLLELVLLLFQFELPPKLLLNAIKISLTWISRVVIFLRAELAPCC